MGGLIRPLHINILINQSSDHVNRQGDEDMIQSVGIGMTLINHISVIIMEMRGKGNPKNVRRILTQIAKPQSTPQIKSSVIGRQTEKRKRSVEGKNSE
jgi:hypothetical protein